MGFFNDARARIARDKQAVNDWFQICENFYREVSHSNQRMADLYKEFQNNSDSEARSQIIKSFEEYLDEVKGKENFFKSTTEFSNNFLIFGMKAKPSKEHMLTIFDTRIPSYTKKLNELKLMQSKEI